MKRMAMFAWNMLLVGVLLSASRAFTASAQLSTAAPPKDGATPSAGEPVQERKPERETSRVPELDLPEVVITGENELLRRVQRDLGLAQDVALGARDWQALLSFDQALPKDSGRDFEWMNRAPRGEFGAWFRAGGGADELWRGDGALFYHPAPWNFLLGGYAAHFDGEPAGTEKTFNTQRRWWFQAAWEKDAETFAQGRRLFYRRDAAWPHHFGEVEETFVQGRARAAFSLASWAAFRGKLSQAEWEQHPPAGFSTARVRERNIEAESVFFPGSPWNLSFSAGYEEGEALRSVSGIPRFRRSFFQGRLSGSLGDHAFFNMMLGSVAYSDSAFPETTVWEASIRRWIGENTVLEFFGAKSTESSAWLPWGLDRVHRIFEGYTAPPLVDPAIGWEFQHFLRNLGLHILVRGELRKEKRRWTWTDVQDGTGNAPAFLQKTVVLPEGDVRRLGIELQKDLFSAWRLELDGLWQESEAGFAFLTDFPEWEGTTTLKKESHRAAWGMRWVTQGKRRARAYDGGDLPAWGRLDLFGEWRWSPLWSLWVVGENINGTRYENILGYPAPSRVFLAGAELRW